MLMESLGSYADRRAKEVAPAGSMAADDGAHKEASRLYALQQLNLLDTPPSESFDRITRMAARIFGLPIAAVSLTDRDRQWFKSRVGIDHDSITRAKAPCAEVAETTGMLVIPDLLSDAYYCDSPLAGSGIRFYAGAPLVTRDGLGLGSLCVLGVEPRTASPEELAALNDLAAMVMAQIELQHAFGRIDPLSGLPNRTQFLDDLDDLARDRAGEPRVAVLLDLARNDQIGNLTRVMGSAYVDGIIKEAGRTLGEALGKGRTVYHVAATQFAFLSLPNVETDSYLTLLAAAFERFRSISTVRFVTTATIGVMPFRIGETGPRDLLHGAHSAAQDARRSDGAIGVYAPSNDVAHRRKFALLNDFGAALESTDQLRLVFQPRVDLASRHCVGAEALLRWRHPTLGDISPAEFVPIIERSSLAKAMTAWVLDAAFGALGGWLAAGLAIPLSINISAPNLEEADFVEEIQRLLSEHRVPPHLVELEVTESAVMEESGHALARLHTLVDMGVRLAIDDFGTGYSSLAYLQRLPAHILKIDQSFILALGAQEDRGNVLVRTMIHMAHQLGYRVVAEGIETAATADLLGAMGCEDAQGFFFARPLEHAGLLPWVTAQNRLPATTR